MTSLFDNVDIVKSGKNFRIPSDTLQHSIFYRKRQIYLLKDVNRCTYTLYIYVFEFCGCQKTCKSELGQMT